MVGVIVSTQTEINNFDGSIFGLCQEKEILQVER
jgi:hypothetical protein